MSEFETAVNDVVDLLIALGVDENEYRAVVNGLGLGQYDDLYSNSENTRELRMKQALRSMRLRDWLDQFEQPLKQLRPADNALGQAVNRLFEATWARRDGWYTTPDPPWKSHVVEDGGIVDREELRRSVGRMLQKTGPKRVLLITGDGELGKTYSAQLLRVVAARRGHKIAEVDLQFWDMDEGGGAGAREVAETLAQQLGLTLSRPGHTTSVKLAQALAIGLADAIRSRMPGQIPWLFIDHVDTSSAKSEEIKPLIHSLAYLAAEQRRNFRLVVVARKLDEQTALGRPAARRALKEQVKSIADADIEKYFLDLAKHVNKEGDFDAAEAKEACQEVWARAGGQGSIFDLPICLWEIAKEKLRE